jgi:methionyl-tRNA formyltransferase
MRKTAILLGSKPASIAALLLLRKHGWDVREVVATPDQADWIPRPTLHEVATSLGIRTVKKQGDLITKEVDLVISYMCRARVKPETLSKGKFPLNFHAGPLPEFGGWAFYNIAILENSNEYGCTCHVMDESFDTGPLVKVRRFAINPHKETAYSLERKAQLEMLLLFEEVLSIYETTGSLPSEHQDPKNMRYMNAQEFEKLKEISLNATAEEVDRIARAFWYPPYEVAHIKTPSGLKVEVIPEMVKRELATGLHVDDLKVFLKICGLKSTETFHAQKLF